MALTLFKVNDPRGAVTPDGVDYAFGQTFYADPKSVADLLGLGSVVPLTSGSNTPTLSANEVTLPSPGLGPTGPTGPTGAPGPTGSNYDVLIKTSNYPVLVGDSGTVFTNTGAGGDIVLTLPAAAVGLEYLAFVNAAHNVRFLASGSNTITNGASTSGAGGHIDNTTVGSAVRLIGLNTSKWVVLSTVGTWTVT